MAKLVTQNAIPGGVLVDLTTAASASGDEFDYSPEAILLVVNDDATTPCNVTITNQKEDNFGGAASLHDATFTVPTGGKMAMFNLGHQRWKDENGLVQVGYDSVTGVSVAVIERGV